MLILFLSESITILNDTITINEWWYLGPFSIGPREGITGLDFDFFQEDFEPDTSASYPSLLVRDGFVKWQRINTPDGNVVIKYDDVAWNTIQNYYGVAGLISTTIAYAAFESKGRKNVLINAQNLGSFILNGRTYPGDVYRDGYVWIPVGLKKGKNKLVVRASGYGKYSFSLKIITRAEPLIIIKDITVPDFIQGESYSGYIGVPVMNTTDQILNNVKIEVLGNEILKTESAIFKIMPLSLIKVPVALISRSKIEEIDSIKVNISAYNDNFKANDSIWIKVRKPNEPYVRTFLSKIDNSCQYYGVLPPKDFAPEATYALIMSCHGAGAEAINQVKSYSQKDWAYIVAPTNRRRYGFDWQDWGRLDFLEVLEDVKKNFKIDKDRVYLTGHSMGGHGVWHIGLSHPDLFAAIAPSAGWSTFQLYIPWFLQRSEIFAEPEQIKFRDMVLREANTLVYLENALNLPVYILHGGADDVVPPTQGRMMSQYLGALDYDFVYNEVEGKGHWWDIDSTLGIDCVDLKEMMEYLKEKKRNPNLESIVFKTSNIGHSNKAYWIRIDELENIYQDGKIIAHVDTTNGFRQKSIQYNIQTENVSAFTIFCEELNNIPKYLLFNINRAKIKCLYNNQKEISFAKFKDGFKTVKYNKKGLKKNAECHGPIKQAYFSPFILVFGTIGDSTDTENNLHQARLQSYNWWIRANGFCEIVPDSQITQEHIKNYNLILFGNSQTNEIIKKINKKLPINFKSDYESIRGVIKKTEPYENYITIKDKVLKISDLCLMEIYPNPLNPDKFVLLYSATTKKAQKYLGLFPVFYSGSGLPDFIVWDESVARYGWAGVIVAGFFDKKWQIDKNLIYLKK